MSKLKSLLCGLTIIALMTSSCSTKKSDSKESDAVAGNAVFNTAMATVNSKLSAIDSTLPNVAGAETITSFSTEKSIHTMANFGSAWNSNPSLSNPRCSGGDSALCSTPVTPKEWMSYQFDPNAVRENGSAINIFGRFESARQIACAMMNILTVDASGYPTDGTQTVEFTAAKNALLVSKCGFPEAQTPPTGTEMELTIATPSNTTVYDKKVTIQLPEAMSGGEQVFYLRMNATEINLLSTEYNSESSQISRTLVAYDKVGDVLRVEYFSANSEAFNFYRVFYNATSDLGSMFGFESNIGDTGGIRYSLVTKPETGAQAALSMDLKGWGSGKTWNANYKACITKETGDIALDNDLNCTDATGVDIDDAGLAAVYNNAFSAAASTGWVTTVTDTTTLDFTESTLFTELASH